MSSWTKVLILAKGSEAILLAKAVSKALLSLSPESLSKFTTAILPSSSEFGAAPRNRRAEAIEERRSWRNEGASWSSAASSMASMSAALPATASALRMLTVCWAKRTVAAEVCSLTAPLMMPMAWVSVDSSAARTVVRWSQVLALCWHIVESLFVYSLSSSKVASTVVRRWLADTMSAMACSFSFLVSSSLWFRSLTRSVLVCVNISNAARDKASILSTSSFSARKSFSRFSKSWMMPPEWKS
mmetsp:Transcript_90904/g.256245  ORF Transcript_90904/g.256245 Transcript_90904/m.256245 type:complete len:243 (-) Transcript_90904:9-737(-)